MSIETPEPFVRHPAWWGKRLKGKGMHLSLLNTLSSHADATADTCFPSQGELAEILGRSRPWVNAAIKELVNLGLLVKVNRIKKTRTGYATTSCLYKLIYRENDCCVAAEQETENADRILSVSPLTPPVKQPNTNKNPTNKSLSEISVDEWEPKPATVTTLTDALGSEAGKRYLGKFRAKVKDRGYQYSDFDLAILEWLDADRKRGLTQTSVPKSGARSSSRPTKEVGSKIDTDVEALMASDAMISGQTKVVAGALLAGSALPPQASEASRFRAACLLVARDRGVDFYRSWLSSLKMGAIKDDTLVVSGGTVFGRRYVSENCDGALTRACRAAGLRFQRLRFS
ncbi:hypothetical protein AYJ57_21665 (plasmid) [Salipiger sp. CCB-MM3]|uniref:helix-turn-helix domain-containing protein n=1 Tax=Salipiger sp. CCB-MM3 TaxID=1792508 RepID=UPI00080AC13A|nr:helix-turn-helix domain-containing protein [Salipiger sp. CCB-MM3]ANT63082.1 hypothetical protein AYJ57_21665 [Salipiger sp. CCB-MM3]